MTEAKTKPAKPTADWELIEKHFRAGLLSLREIAKAADDVVTEGAIRKRAKKDGWTRNLKAKIAQRTEELVRKSAVRETSTQLTPVTEVQVIDAVAQLQTSVALSHRTDSGRLKKLMVSLLSELERTTDNIDLFGQLGELLDESGPDHNGTWRTDKLNELYRKVISMGGRVDNAKKLTEIFEKLVKLEREAYGLDTAEDGKGGIEDVLAGIGRKLKDQSIG